MNKLIPVSNKNVLIANGIYIQPSTLRKWHHLGRHATLFLKIANKLMLDLNEWDKLVENAKAERDIKITRLQKLDLIKVRGEKYDG